MDNPSLGGKWLWNGAELFIVFTVISLSISFKGGVL